MTILIFGGAGFIGTNVALEAIKQGKKVIAFDNLSRKGSEENVQVITENGGEFILGDIRKQRDLLDLPDVDAIVNLAANPAITWSIDDPINDFKINALGALHILEFARAKGNVPIIFASTNKVYSDEINDLPMKEKKTRYSVTGEYIEGIPESFAIDGKGKYPHSPYGCSKVAADIYHQEYFHLFKVPVVINRMSCIYGLYQKGVSDQGWVDHFVRVIQLGDGNLDIYGDGKQVRDMLFGEDLAKLYLRQIDEIDRIKGNVFNVGGGLDANVSLIEAIGMIEDITGKKANLTFHDWRHADQKVYISNTRKVKKIMNWQPATNVEKGLEKMVKFYASRGK